MKLGSDVVENSRVVEVVIQLAGLPFDMQIAQEGDGGKEGCKEDEA